MRYAFLAIKVAFMLNSKVTENENLIQRLMTENSNLKHLKPKTLYKSIFQRALIREFMNNGMLLFSVLLGIVVISQLIRFLSEAVSGKLAVEGVLALLGFSAMNYLPVLLSLSLFLSILLTLSRSFRDSEMVVWFGSGIGLTYWIRPVMTYATPVIFVIGMLSLVAVSMGLAKGG